MLEQITIALLKSSLSYKAWAAQNKKGTHTASLSYLTIIVNTSSFL